MMNWSFNWPAAVVILTLVIGRASATAEILCDDAVSRLLPCGNFLKSIAPVPSAACCSAVKSLDKIAVESPENRKVLCECFKDAANSFPINLVKARQLRKLCNATGVEIGPDINCNR
ncbi:hypothetical protein CDL12_22648 [Handroanthus impetiginosus]|uniref:Bifunctional inhibitor/plant lipid transfer protein/seed storage helical domain-containing protein n=1 Tax=Handroanthus impetiginosus TaxID=429701 RepID=A0A2G9GHN9_9LAMI|nr:hypothetical protein CDL12_22648 [Handroanthus impetiginosus]